MSTPSHLDDEQLTALQDGDGTADERAHLAGCSRCTERSQALTAVAALVATPPPAPSDQAREAAVAAALAGADRRVVPLARRPRRQVPAWLLPAAAVVALLALVAAVVPQLGGGDDSDGGDSAASVSRDQAESGSEGDDAASGDTGGAASEAPGLRRSAQADLGVVDDEGELARRVEEALATEAAADAGPAASDPCVASLLAADLTLEPLRLRASLVWRGQPAEVLSDGARAVVVAVGGCARLADVDLR